MANAHGMVSGDEQRGLGAGPRAKRMKRGEAAGVTLHVDDAVIRDKLNARQHYVVD